MLQVFSSRQCSNCDTTQQYHQPYIDLAYTLENPLVQCFGLILFYWNALCFRLLIDTYGFCYSGMYIRNIMRDQVLLANQN